MEALSKLRPLFEGGVVTAGNASGINDGAAALLVGSRAAGERVGARPLAQIVAAGAAGVEPRVMGLGPVYAIPKALARAGLTLDEMDLIEINEAFASQVLGCLKLLGISFDDSRVNPNGGAIAVGHPAGGLRRPAGPHGRPRAPAQERPPRRRQPVHRRGPGTRDDHRAHRRG